MTRDATVGLCVSTAIVAGAAMILVATAAGLVVVLEAAPLLRSELNFTFAGVPRTTPTAISIAAHNAAIAAAPLLAAAAHPHAAVRMRQWVTAGLVLLVAINGAAVGLVVGAYGRQALVALVPHGPIELLAFSIAGGAFMQACQQPLSRGALLAASAISIALVTGAAVVEILITNPGGRA